MVGLELPEFLGKMADDQQVKQILEASEENSVEAPVESEQEEAE